MKEYTVDVNKTYTQEDIDDILCAAFEGGISYWAEGIEVVNNDYKGGKYGHEVLTRGGRLYIMDEYGTHELELDKVLKAVAKLNIDMEAYDAVDADAVVQIALFGEVVYG